MLVQTTTELWCDSDAGKSMLRRIHKASYNLGLQKKWNKRPVEDTIESILRMHLAVAPKFKVSTLVQAIHDHRLECHWSFDHHIRHKTGGVDERWPKIHVDRLRLAPPSEMHVRVYPDCHTTA